MGEDTQLRGTSRRDFLSALGAAAFAALSPLNLPLVRADAAPVGSGGVPPDPLAAAAANPNFETLRRIVGPVVKSESGRTILWTEKRDGGQYKVMKWQPETLLERADAEELYELSRWRSWRTPDELRALVRRPGPWVVRMNLSETYCLLSASCARRMTAGGVAPDWHHAADAFTREPDEAARLTSRQVLDLIPPMAAGFGVEEVVYFEPIEPENALKETRLLRLRASGWGTVTYQRYDLDELARLYRCDGPLVRPPKHPFVKTPMGWLCLIDFGAGPGTAAFDAPGVLRWSSDCPNLDAPGHDQSCDCMPAEMRDWKEMLLVQVFARPADGPAGRYADLGLGHVDSSPHRGAARLRLEPDLKRDVYASLGGYAGWEVRVGPVLANGNEWADAGPAIRLESEGDLRNCLEGVTTMRAATILLSRWGGDHIGATVIGGNGIVKAYARVQGKLQYLTLVNPACPHDPNAEVWLGGEGQVPSTARTIIPRAEVLEAIGCYFRDAQLLRPERWVADVYDLNSGEQTEGQAGDSAAGG